MIALILSLVLFFQAQDTLKTLNEISVYGVRETTPVTYSTINTATPLNMDGSFVLRNYPNIINYSDNGSIYGYSYFRIRGIDQTRINVNIDGIPLNEPEDQGIYFSNFPGLFSFIEDVYIQRGNSSSQNGNAAYAGTINLFTPALYNANTLSFTSSLGSFNTYSQNFYAHSKNAATISVNTISTDGYKSSSSHFGNSVFLKTGNDSFYALLLVGQQKNDMAWIGATKEDLISFRTYNSNTPEEKDDFTQARLSLHKNFTHSASFLSSIAVYTAMQDGFYTFDLNNFLNDYSFPSTIYTYNLTSQTFGGYYNATYILGKTTHTTGAHVSIYSRDHLGEENNVQLYKNTGNYNSFSINHSVVIKPSANVSFFADAQIRNINFKYAGTPSLEAYTWSFFNPKVGAKYKNSYISWSSTYREPTRLDMFYGNDTYDGTYEVDFSAENVKTLEVGYRGKSFSVNYYNMQFDNELTLVGGYGPSGLPLTRKVNNSTRQGVELERNSKFLHTSLSMSRNTIQHNSEKFNHAFSPEFVLTNTLCVRRLTITHRFIDDFYVNLANTEEYKIKKHATVDASFKLLSVDSHVTVVLHSFNILNSNHYTTGYVDSFGAARYFVNPPRSFMFSFKINS